MIAPLYLFVFAGLFSPGPNVILLTASGARFGFRATLPHAMGVVLGAAVTSGLTGLGLGALLDQAPQLKLTLKIIAAAWILWMAWKLLQSARIGTTQAPDKPFTLLQAALFQWVNPKVWAVALAAAAGYGAGLSPLQDATRLAIAFSSINLGVCLFWSFAGALLRTLQTKPRAWSLFMGAMAAALALSALLVFL